MSLPCFQPPQQVAAFSHELLPVGANSIMPSCCTSLWAHRMPNTVVLPAPAGPDSIENLDSASSFNELAFSIRARFSRSSPSGPEFRSKKCCPILIDNMAFPGDSPLNVLANDLSNFLIPFQLKCKFFRFLSSQRSQGPSWRFGFESMSEVTGTLWTNSERSNHLCKITG